MLQKELEKNNISYRYFHLLSKNNSVVSSWHENKLISILIRKIRSLKNNWLGSVIKIATRLLNVLADSQITTRLNKRLKTHDVIIYDRYFYDILVILAFDFPHLSDFILSFSRLIKHPDIIIIFQVEPETAVNRKAEHNLRQAKIYCQIYKHLADILGIELIDAQQPIEAIKTEVLNMLPPKLIQKL